MRTAMRVQSAICALIASLTGLIFCVGCSSLRNEVNPGLLGVEPPKLVVTCFLSPQDTLLTVKVTRSNTVVGDSIGLLQTGNNVTDATVTLSEGSQSIMLSNKIVLGLKDDTLFLPYYRTDAFLLPILTGHTYMLTVSTPNGQRVSSTCTIPAPVRPTVTTLDTTNRRYAVRTRWQDPAGQINYYQVAGIFRSISATCKACQNESYSSLSFDDDNRGLFTDSGIDGTIMVSGRAYLTPTSASSTTNFYSQYKTASVTVDLMSVDQAYYRFQEAIIRQRRSRNNPFAEPVLIPSNINGGLGCFGGYNNATMTLQLK